MMKGWSIGVEMEGVDRRLEEGKAGEEGSSAEKRN